jgi:hypothetical protein
MIGYAVYLGLKDRNEVMRGSRRETRGLAAWYLRCSRRKSTESLIYLTWFLSPFLVLFVPMFLISWDEAGQELAKSWWVLLGATAWALGMPYLMRYTEDESEEHLDRQS